MPFLIIDAVTAPAGAQDGLRPVAKFAGQVLRGPRTRREHGNEPRHAIGRRAELCRRSKGCVAGRRLSVLGRVLPDAFHMGLSFDVDLAQPDPFICDFPHVLGYSAFNPGHEGSI